MYTIGNVWRGPSRSFAYPPVHLNPTMGIVLFQQRPQLCPRAPHAISWVSPAFIHTWPWNEWALPPVEMYRLPVQAVLVLRSHLLQRVRAAIRRAQAELHPRRRHADPDPPSASLPLEPRAVGRTMVACCARILLSSCSFSYALLC